MKFPEGNPISQGKDFKSDHLQFVEDIDEDMKDLIVECFLEADTKVGEGAFTGDIHGSYPL